MHALLAELFNVLRLVRDGMDFFGDMNIHGFPLDWVFHFIVAYSLMLFLSKLLSVKKRVLLICILIVLKELADIFAKSKTDYIVSPGFDMVKDVIAGLSGIFIFVKFPWIPWEKKREVKTKTDA